MPARLLNPDFPADAATIDSHARRLRQSPASLARPVVILGGWHAPLFSIMRLERLLRPLTSGRHEDFLMVAYPWAWSVDAAVDSAILQLRQRGLIRSGVTPEADVVAISMGGIVARKLATVNAGLRIRRIFTLNTPHRGASIARIAQPDRAARDLTHGSDLLRALDAALSSAEYELVCYTLLRDWFVGARNTAPPARASIWLDPAHPVERIASHFLVASSRPLAVDIALRLRGEVPLARENSHPPID